MKHYKSPDNKVFAYEADGSQDHIIPENYVAVTDEEAIELNRAYLASISEPIPEVQPTKEELMAKLLEIQAQLENM